MNCTYQAAASGAPIRKRHTHLVLHGIAKNGHMLYLLRRHLNVFTGIWVLAWVHEAPILELNALCAVESLFREDLADPKGLFRPFGWAKQNEVANLHLPVLHEVVVVVVVEPVGHKRSGSPVQESDVLW